jgi:hypothetical protein
VDEERQPAPLEPRPSVARGRDRLTLPRRAHPAGSQNS